MGNGKNRDPRELQDLRGDVGKLRAEIGAFDRRLKGLEAHGGFADTKTLSRRCEFIERRLDDIELDAPMLKDVTSHLTEAMQEHLVYRHGVAPTLLESAGDVMAVRNIRRRLMLWLEKISQRKRRPGVNDVRRNENRIRSVMGERPNLPPLLTKGEHRA